ncbi:MAG: 50S ribosomal protein L31e [Candidatus Aenigmarchaeota archaeon]|nr:50S ribosomal protein L31e [Candidatus Aenigmarchaeota archaeon]
MYFKRTPYAMQLIRSYLARHMKSGDVRLGRNLNEAVWTRGIKRPPRKVRVRAVRDGETVRAELLGFSYEEFKATPKTEKKGMKEKLMERLGPKAVKKQEEEKAAEGTKKPEEAPKIEQQKVESE